MHFNDILQHYGSVYTLSKIQLNAFVEKGQQILHVAVVHFDLVPACIEDKSLGVHNYVTTKSKIRFHYVANGEVGKPLMLFLHGFPEVCNIFCNILLLTPLFLGHKCGYMNYVQY